MDQDQEGKRRHKKKKKRSKSKEHRRSKSSSKPTKKHKRKKSKTPKKTVYKVKIEIPKTPDAKSTIISTQEWQNMINQSLQNLPLEPSNLETDKKPIPTFRTPVLRAVNPKNIKKQYTMESNKFQLDPEIPPDFDLDSVHSNHSNKTNKITKKSKQQYLQTNHNKHNKYLSTINSTSKIHNKPLETDYKKPEKQEYVSAPLPNNWMQLYTEDGVVYYYNIKTGQQVFRHPGKDATNEVSLMDISMASLLNDYKDKKRKRKKKKKHMSMDEMYDIGRHRGKTMLKLERSETKQIKMDEFLFPDDVNHVISDALPVKSPKKRLYCLV